MNRSSRPSRAVGVWVAILAALATPRCCLAGVVEETAEVTLVEVPVEVSTAAGEPVLGLGPGDFELFDRGVRQNLSGVAQIDLGSMSETNEEVVFASARRRILLLFDLAFSRPASLERARGAAGDFVLNILRPADLAAVVIVTPENGPRMLVNFTSDRTQLARAIETLGAPELLSGAKIDDPLRLLIESPIANPGSGFGSALSSSSLGQTAAAVGDARSEQVLNHLRSIGRRLEDQGKRRQRDRIAAWSEAMAGLARTLGSLPGRKHILVFSEGFDGRLLMGEQGDTTVGIPAAGSRAVGNLESHSLERDSLERERGESWLHAADDDFGAVTLRESMRQVVEAFRRADAVVDTIDISGLVALSDTARRGRRASLQTLALGTGGQHYGGSNALAGLLERALESTLVTYVLSFQPRSLLLDGSFHELEVRLSKSAGLGRGTKLTHRQGYYAPRPFRQLHPLEKKLLTADAVMTAAPRRELDMEVLVAAFQDSPRTYVPVIVEIDGQSLLAGQSTERLEVEIFAYVTNEQGEMRDFLTYRADFDLEQARLSLQAGGLKFYGHLDLDAGQYRVRVLGRNAETGRTSVWAAPLTIADPLATEPRLLPPFFIEAPDTWLLVREAPTSDRVVYPFLWKGEPFVPAARPVVRRETVSEVVLVAYGFGEGPVDADIRVLSVTGQALSGGRFELLDREPGFGRTLLRGRFDSRDLPLGEYRLETTLSQQSDGISATSACRILVTE